MSRGAVVGEAGPSLTLALGLLYAALVRRANGAHGFRFSTSVAGQAIVGPLYAALLRGERPAPPAPDELAKVSFALDFPDSLGKRLLGSLRRPPPGGAHELDLGVLPLAPGPSRSALVPPASAWGAAIDLDLLVVVDDASGALPPNGPLDAGVGELVGGLPRGPPRCLLVCLLDAPANPGVTPTLAGEARDALAADTWHARLPSTHERLAAAGQAPPCAFAWVAPDPSGGPGRIMRRQLLEAGGIEPEYPYDELVALMDALAAHAR